MGRDVAWWMLLGYSRFAVKPLSEFFLGYFACFALGFRGLPISPRLALHEDEFHVVLDDSLWDIILLEKKRRERRVPDCKTNDRPRVTGSIRHPRTQHPLVLGPSFRTGDASAIESISLMTGSYGSPKTF